MENSIKKSDLLNYLGKFKVVSTQSGPVQPAKSKVIDVMTKKIMKPVSGDQTSGKWDKRKYELNDNLCMNRNYLTVKDVANKVMVEANSQTPYTGCRLDLSSIDAKSEHAKFTVERKGHTAIVEILYPNNQDKLSLSVTLPDMPTSDKNPMRSDIDLDSKEFTGNFGLGVIKRVDDAIEANTTDSLSDISAGEGKIGGMGSSVNDLNNSIIQPSAMVQESVDWRLAKLLDVCNEAAMFEGGEFGAADFAAGGEGGGDAAANPAPAAPGGDAPATDPNAVNSDGSNDEEMQNFRDYAEANFSTTQGGIMDHIVDIISDCEYRAIQDNSSGIKPSRHDIKDGYAGIKNETFNAKINAFLEFFPELDDELPIKQLDAMADYLDNNYDSANEFKIKLAEFFPELYDKAGNPLNSVANDVANVDLPGEDEMFAARNPEENVDLSGIMPTSGPVQGGDFTDFLDNANTMAGGEDTFGTENGNEGEDIDIPQLPNI